MNFELSDNEVISILHLCRPTGEDVEPWLLFELCDYVKTADYKLFKRNAFKFEADYLIEENKETHFDKTWTGKYVFNCFEDNFYKICLEIGYCKRRLKSAAGGRTKTAALIVKKYPARCGMSSPALLPLSGCQTGRLFSFGFLRCFASLSL